MADADRNPLRRSSDQRWTFRVRRWWRANGVQVVVFVLLGVIVAGQVSQLLDSRAQARRDASTACVLRNLSATNAESLRQLRVQAPVIDAASQLITAVDDEERRRAEATLRRAVVERDRSEPSVEDLPPPEACG